ncbi:MAG: ion transporter [Prevotella sp.]|jgi:voltage-gated potassium channel|nr:ion transporter [Prevotella sp.]MCH4182350.1 ion transporter [Prevotella sp.]MCH4212491.1 ion transporter [Prevotella sp.]MCH4240722.1 ion transporter [Prevotella sp.]MCI1742078.1 ion transporter [Prevotella sp.]
MVANTQLKNHDKFSLFDFVIIVLSAYVLIALFISTVCHLSKNMMDLLDMIDNFICIIFLIDFIHNFYTAKNKLAFMRWGWIDLISSIPTFTYLRYGRLFKLIRLLRILRAFRSTKIIVRYIFKSKIKGTMVSVFIITILMIIFSSIAILNVEKAPNSNIKTASDALWWTIETITTVGYGDKYPVTNPGRVIGTMLMICGVGLFGTYTAYIASFFVNNKENTTTQNKK